MHLDRIKLAQKGLLIVAVPLMFELLLVGSLLFLLNETERQAQHEASERAIASEANRCFKRMIELIALGSAYNVTGNDTVFDTKTSLRQFFGEIENLSRVMAEDPKRAQAAGALSASLKQGVDMLDRMKRARDANDKLAAYGYIQKLKPVAADVSRQLSAIVEESESSARLFPASQERLRNQIKITLYLAVALSFVVAGGVVVYFTNDISARLKQIMEHAVDLSSGKEIVCNAGGSDEIAQLDRAFHDAENKLEQLAARRDELIAVLSHDLRTPLTSMKMFLSLIQSGSYGTLSDKGQTRLTLAQSELSRLVALINDLLDAEAMRAGKLELTAEKCDAQCLVNGACLALQPMYDQCNISLRSEGESFQLIADEPRMMQVLINLLTNACKFSPAGSCVTVTTYLEDGHACFAISDEGAGIPDADCQRLFQPFERGDNIANTEGHGLGLSICNAIVTAHGGTITVERNAEKGTKFTLKLPEAVVQGEAQAV